MQYSHLTAILLIALFMARPCCWRQLRKARVCCKSFISEERYEQIARSAPEGRLPELHSTCVRACLSKGVTTTAHRTPHNAHSTLHTLHILTPFLLHTSKEN